MPGTHQVAAAVLDRANHVTKLLVSHARHEREVQLAGRQQAGQALGVALVRLDPITRRPGDLPGGDDPDVDAARGASPGEPETSRPGLVDRADRPRQRREELHDLDRRHSQLHAAKLTG